MNAIKIMTVMCLLFVAILLPVASALSVGLNSEVYSSGEQKVITVDGIEVTTQLGIEVGSENRLMLSNGLYAEINIMPSVASETAIASLRVNACSEENNCTIELKEYSSNNEVRATYEVKVQKEYKLLGLFMTKADIRANVDAETGTVISTNVPWWTSISTEVSGEADSQASVEL